jgi:hypothetical protein
MMAKMFYTLDEARAALGKNEEEIKQFAREGRLREFRDGPRLMFKADQVEQLKAELAGGGGMDHVDLGPSDSGAPIGLVDSRSASGSGISLVDSDLGGTGGGSASGMQLKDDTALAADLGLSGSIGGMPSPRAPGGTVSGTGLTGSMAGSRAGVNVFGADDSIEHADPMAQTAISQGAVPDQINLEGIGSGSGLLDLTRESDDTSLGAELLDEIAPGRSGSRGAISDSREGTGVAGLAEPRGGRVAGSPIMLEARDSSASAFGAAALGASLFLIVGSLVLTSAVVGTRPGIVQTLTEQSFVILLGIGLGVALIFGVVGLLIGKSAR